MQYIDNNSFNNHILSAPQQLQQGQGYPQSPQQAMSHQQNMQSHQQNERDQRQYEQEQMMLQQANNAFYSSAAQDSANMQGMMFSGSNQQSSPHAFQWPPSSPAQHQQPQQGQTRMDGNLGGGSMFQNDLSFSPSTYYNASQADAEIEAILSNYRPKMMSDMHTYDSGTKENVNHASSSQQVAPASQMREGNLSGSSSASADRAGGSTKKAGHIDSKKAAAAAAAYGHFNYQSGSTSDQATSGQWNNVKTATTKGPSSTGGLSSGLDFQSSHSGGRGKYGSTGAEDADASNTSSAQTPGGVSSGEDSLNGKRRRMTAGGGMSGKEQQERFESGQSTGGIDGKGASMTQSVVGGARPIMQHHSASLVDSRELEKIAQETLLRASQENARGSSTLSAALRKAPVRPTITHRKSQSGPNVSASMSGSQTSIQTAVDAGPPTSPHRRPTGSGHASALSMGGSHSFHQSAPSAALGAYATSHAPGLGGPIMRTPSDLTVNSAHGATEFTKRKGWPTRIVEELLDFVHVLDREGKVLFASPSVLTLTGWRAEELQGKDLTDFIHPDDQSSVRSEFEKSLRKRSEMTMYYRFRRKPQTASDKQRVHDQRILQQVSRSRSGSTSGGDTSSAPDSLNGQNKGKSTTFATGALDNHLAGVGLDSVDEEGEFQDDHRDKYVIFEATGHPYISPDDTLLDSELKEDLVEQLLPQVLSQGVKKESPDRPEQGSISSALDVQCFFCSCRIYPTKNVGMLDSFLELKLENERLRTLLSEFSVSEGPGHNAALDGASDGRRSLDEAPAGYHLDYEHDGDQQHHEHLSSNQVGGHNQGGGAQNGMGGSAGFASSYTGEGRRDSLVSAGQMSHPTSPLTAQSLEKNAENQAAMADDAEEPTSPNILTAEERRRRKKTKPEEGDYVCTDCGRVDSPEWRKGPLGPKTLCNACGLRWAKKVKRNGGDPNAIAMAANPAKGQIQAQAAAARAHQQNLHFQQQDNVGESLRSVGHTGLPTSDMSGVVQQQSNSGAYPSHSPPNHFDGNSFNSLYGGDPSAMAHLGTQAAFLQSRGLSYGPNTMQQPHQTNYDTHMN